MVVMGLVGVGVVGVGVGVGATTTTTAHTTTTHPPIHPPTLTQTTPSVRILG